MRLLVGALLLALTFAGGYAVSASKTVTLTIDGTSMQVQTMRSRVIDIVRENGFSVEERDDLYPAADVSVGDAGTIVLRRSRPWRSPWTARTPGRCGPRRRPLMRRWRSWP